MDHLPAHLVFDTTVPHIRTDVLPCSQEQNGTGKIHKRKWESKDYLAPQRRT